MATVQKYKKMVYCLHLQYLCLELPCKQVMPVIVYLSVPMLFPSEEMCEKILESLYPCSASSPDIMKIQAKTLNPYFMATQPKLTTFKPSITSCKPHRPAPEIPAALVLQEVSTYIIYLTHKYTYN